MPEHIKEDIYERHFDANYKSLLPRKLGSYIFDDRVRDSTRVMRRLQNEVVDMCGGDQRFTKKMYSRMGGPSDY